MIQSLPGKLLRIVTVPATTLVRVRLVPNASIIFVEASDTRLHIQYTSRHSDTLVFPTVDDRDRALAIVQRHFCIRDTKDVPLITDYPYPEYNS